MTLLDPRAEFVAGLEHAAQHWLAFWQHNGHDVEAQRQARGHALRALLWCADWGQDAERAADLVLALDRHMMWAGQWAEWELCLRRVIAGIGPQVRPERRFELQGCLAAIYFRLHRLDEALALARENERIAAALGDVRRQEAAAVLLAETYLNEPRFDFAQAHAERAVELAVSLGDQVLEADALIDLARALLGQDRIAEAEQHLARAYDLATAAEDTIYRCKAQLFRGHAAAARRDWSQSLIFCSEALNLVTSYGDEVGRGVVLTNMGRALIELGSWDEADQTLTEALRIHRFHGNTPAERVCVQRLQELHAHRGSIQDGGDSALVSSRCTVEGQTRSE